MSLPVSAGHISNVSVAQTISWVNDRAMSSREMYKQARRIRIAIGLSLMGGIVAIVMVAMTYHPG